MRRKLSMNLRVRLSTVGVIRSPTHNYSMNIHQIYAKVSPMFRRKRMKLFFDTLAPRMSDKLLDLGGYPFNWIQYGAIVSRLDVLNLDPIQYSHPEAERCNIRTIHGNACQLTNEQVDYDIVFSNSVIEHLGSWENQVKFAENARKAGKRLWIQTPARSFPVEPHYICPFIHYFPVSIQRRLIRHFTPWGLMTKPTRSQVDGKILELRLLSYAEMRTLFPDCRIIKEKFFGVLTKSYIAVR